MTFILQSLKKINFDSLKKELLLWFVLFIFLFILSFIIDLRPQLWQLIQNFHTPALDSISVIFTEHIFWGSIISLSIFSVWHMAKYKQNQYLLLPLLFSVLTTSIVIFILKAYFDFDRPFEVLNILPVIDLDISTSGTSFPSGHAAVSWALFLPLYRKHKTLGLIWFLFACLISLSRVYQILHFPTDIAAGIFVGGIIGSFFSHPTIAKILDLLWQNLEFRRQSFHFLAGFLCVFTHWIGLLRWRFILVILVLGLVLSWLAQRKRIPLVSTFLDLFERTEEKKFPGKGAFFYLFAVMASIILFPVKIAYASILILAVGDSMNHFFANVSQVKNQVPWNHRKTILGVILGIISGTFAAQFFVGLFPAFIATTITLLLESTRWNIQGFYIDDNITVPLVAGGMLLLLV